MNGSVQISTDAPLIPIHKLQKIEISENSEFILRHRYLRKGQEGIPVESPEEMFWRVADNISQIERKYDARADVEAISHRFYSMMAHMQFLPNSPTLMNAGRELQQLSACFVLPIEDSMDSIFETLKHTALIHKSGGGTGFSFSRLRPKNDIVRTTHGVASGPVSFMKVFDGATEIVKQGGTRRGANMGILRVDHPDILEFISCKEHEDSVANFNISVAVTEEFMRKAEAGEDYPLINPRNGSEAGRLNAMHVFKLIVNMAWRTGDPGIVFIDRINKTQPTPEEGLIESTNPCGEQPLLPYESCNLGSINLAKFVVSKNGNPEVDYDSLGRIIPDCVRFLDNIIDANSYPLPEIERITRANRKIGLGVMGFADMLIRLGIPYDSEPALMTAENVMKFIHEEARTASRLLAEKRGAFPNFVKSSYASRGEPQQRNATLTTVAPTGTIALIADCSSGIEPIFAVAYERRHTIADEPLRIVHPYFEKTARDEGFFSPELIGKITGKSSIRSIGEVPEHIRKVYITAHEISPEWHVRMQASFQKYTDNAVSKTVNFPRDATPADIHEVYMLAYRLGCKGVTVYRDESKHRQILSLRRERPEPEAHPVRARLPRERPKVTHGITEKVMTSDGTLYVTINRDDFGLCEVFTNIGKHGSDVASWSEAVGRLISLSLRSGIPLEAIVDQLIGITSKPIWQEGELILSVPDAIGRILARYLKEHEAQLTLGFQENGGKNSGIEQSSRTMTDALTLRCPECGNVMEKESGCVTCRFCGFTQCG